MNTFVLTPDMDKLWPKLGSFALFEQPVKEKGNSKRKPIVLH